MFSTILVIMIDYLGAANSHFCSFPFNSVAFLTKKSAFLKRNVFFCRPCFFKFLMLTLFSVF